MKAFPGEQATKLSRCGSEGRTSRQAARVGPVVQEVWRASNQGTPFYREYLLEF